MDPPVDEDAILHGMLDGDSPEPQPVTSILASSAARNALRKSTASMSSSKSSMRRTRSTFAGSSASLGGSNSSRNSVVSIDQSTMLVGIDDLGLQGTAAAPSGPHSGGMRYRKPLQSGNDDDVSPLPSRLARTSTRSSTNLLSDDGMAPLSSARRSSTNSTNRLASRTNLRSTSDLAAATGSPRAVGSLRRMSRDPGALGSTARLSGALGSTTRLADAPAPRRGSVGNLLSGGDSPRVPLGSRKSSIAASSTALAKARTKSSGTLLGSMTSVRGGAPAAAAAPPAPRKDAKSCMNNIDAALLDAERNFRTPLVGGNSSPGPTTLAMPQSARSSLHSALPCVGPGRTSITSSAASQRPGMLPPLPGAGEGSQQQRQQQQQPAAVASDVSPAPRRFLRITSGAPITAALLHEAATQRKDTVRSVTNRLTDPDRYPDAFKHRIEAIHQRKLSVIQHQHELDPDDKLTPADLGAALPPMDHISDRAAAVTDRLYRPAPAPSPAPPTAPPPARARPKPRNDANRGIDFFNEFARGASRIQDVPAAAAATNEQTGSKHEEAAGEGVPLAGIFGDVPLREGRIKKVTAMSMGNLTVIK
ncbi:hypothetical protein AMAG_08086 [Allomyces macrogynus ATCC 38327]|uniref:Uncharacterized protein n=1 Tax=Allomyces macrogynus (strain ATCC 38327) TaxID=578462 RepID=A0A0L0SKC2_ALLM3|nr:hypothetical protein AMAG_08086 [Allomyces macrogynus ATCC 38327]|eukprot:KNE62908.1 hypothetical protein AMAG_08086 [Allomyces macrogynus ATCC 38327]